MLGRPVVVLKIKNFVPEQNIAFQVNYKPSSLALIQKPLVLVAGKIFSVIPLFVL